MNNVIDIGLLKVHPRNIDIYGQEDIKELADRIKQSEWIKPLVVTKDNKIISGHRRYKACLSLGKTEIPIDIVEFENENEELERLLLENESREKTTYQKTNEGLMWEEIYKIKAKEKMSLGGQGKENSPTLEKGQTRDLVAEKINIGSGKTYETAKKVVNEIEKLKEGGKDKEAEFLKASLNQSVNGAKNLVNVDLSKIEDDIKEKVINKEITVKEAVKDIKKGIEITKEKESKGKENYPTLEIKEEMKVCNECKQEKSIHNFYEGKNKCIECYKSNINPKNVYGREIKIDKEKIKGIDIEAIIADTKDTNKSICNTNAKSLSMELNANADMFIQNVRKYLEFEEQFEDMDKENKDNVMERITSIEEILNQIKGFLF